MSHQIKVTTYHHMECHNFQSGHRSKVAHQVSSDPAQSRKDPEETCPAETGLADSYTIQADLVHTFGTSTMQTYKR